MENKYARHTNITYNEILNVGYLAADCGPFYENINSPSPLIDVTLAYNICFANYAKANNHGLYIDNITSGGLLHHNVVIGDPDHPFPHGIMINAIGDNSQNRYQYIPQYCLEWRFVSS